MSNLAKIVKASKDPHCIMSVIPNNGETWASSVQDGYQSTIEDRDFSKGVKEWTTYDAWITQQDLTQDFELICTFRCVEGNVNQPIFQCAPVGSSFLGVMHHTNDSIMVYSALARRVGTTAIYYNANPIATADMDTDIHTIVMRLVGDTFSVYCDDVLITSESVERIPFTLGNAHKSREGLLYDVRIKNLTTGSEWDAKTEMPRLPQPVTAPRNFATNPKFWTNYDVWFNRQNKTDDFEFTCEFQNVTPGNNSMVFYASGYGGATSMFNIYTYQANNTNFITFFARAVGSSATYYAVPLKGAGAFDGNKHTVVAKFVGNTLTVSFDGVQKANVTVERFTPIASIQTLTDDGHIPFVGVKNLTTGDEWKYPNNITEKVQLLELENTDTSGGVFKSADLTQYTWYGKTALNLAGRSTSFTALGKMYIAPDSGDNDIGTYHPLMQQGFTQSGIKEGYVFGLLYINQNGQNGFKTYVSFADTQYSIKFVTALPQNTIVTIATTVDFSTGLVKGFINGELINTATLPITGKALREDTSNVYNTDSVYIRQLQAGWQNRNDKIYWAMVYDGVLSDTEIKYLSTDAEQIPSSNMRTGFLYGAGENANHTLNSADTSDKISLAKLTPYGGCSEISTGRKQTIGIFNDGELWGCGLNDQGQLGLGGTTPSPSLTRIGNRSDWATVSARAQQTAGAITRAGELYASGSNFRNALGIADVNAVTVFTRVGTASNWSQLTYGNFHGLAINTLGELWGWGWNLNGQLGQDNTIDSAIPIRIGTETNWIKVSGGAEFTMALNSLGELWGCGVNIHRQLGQGDTIDRHVLTKVESTLGWVDVVCGPYYTLAINTAGELWGWGWFGGANLALLGTNSSVPAKLTDGTAWVSCVASYSAVMLLNAQGELYVAGLNKAGVLGLGHTDPVRYFTKLSEASDWSAVTSSLFNHFIALKQ